MPSRKQREGEAIVTLGCRKLGLGKRESRCLAGSLALSAIVCFYFAPAGAQPLPEGQPPNVAPGAAPEVFTIPDGTPVQLRFAQPVRGMARGGWGRITVEAKPGDKVRLVVGSAVRVNGLVVISKGAIGQATVDKVWLPIKTYDRHGNDTTRPQTGLSLRLDWIEDVTGQQVSLRASPAGEAKPFTVEVLSKNGGMVARPASLRRDLIQSVTFANLITMFHERTWIPVGTRLQAFVHGASALDATELKQAQALLPAPNLNATLTIYRKKGQRDSHPQLLCDDKKIASLDERQYAVLNLASGAHTCHVVGHRAFELNANAGEEYFLQLQHREFADVWELKLVTTAEGEDAIADLELAGEH
jgi:hypothetical protein